MINFSCLYTKFPLCCTGGKPCWGAAALIVRYCFEQTDGLIDLLLLSLTSKSGRTPKRSRRLPSAVGAGRGDRSKPDLFCGN